MFVVDREHACAASEYCRIFPRDQSVHLLHWKIRITRCEKSSFYPVLAKIRINRRFLKRKPKEIIRTTSFIRFWRRSRLTESGLTEVYC